MGITFKNLWGIISVFLTALSLIKLANTYTPLHIDKLFLDIASYYNETIGAPFVLLRKYFHVSIPVYIRHLLVIYLLFGGALASFIHFEITVKIAKPTSKAVRYTLVIAESLFWPIFIVLRIRSNLDYDRKLAKAFPANRADIKWIAPPKGSTWFDRFGAFVFRKTRSTTVAVLVGIGTLLCIQVSMFVLAVLWSFAT